MVVVVVLLLVFVLVLLLVVLVVVVVVACGGGQQPVLRLCLPGNFQHPLGTVPWNAHFGGCWSYSVKGSQRAAQRAMGGFF